MSEHLWQEQAKEIGGQALVEMLTAMQATQNTILNKLNHAENFYSDVLQKVERLEGGFPNGDPFKHCQYHEMQMEILQEKRRLTAAIREKTISGLVWAALVGIGLSVWNYAKDHLK